MAPQSRTSVRRTLIVLGLFGLAACSSPATNGGNPEAAAPNTASPLDEYLNAGFDQATNEAKEKQVQEGIAVCMAELGFTYRPYTPDLQLPDEQEGFGDRAWTEKNGYGITTSAMVQVLDQDEDPNLKLREAMTESEMAAYDKALYGSGGGMVTMSGGGSVTIARPGMVIPTPGSDPHTGTDEGGPGDGPAPSSGAETEPVVPGCFESARLEIFGAAPQLDLGVTDELFDQLGTLAEAVDKDPRVAPAVTAWSDCMADAGFPGFDAIEDAQNSIMAKWATLNGWEFDPEAGGVGRGMSMAATMAVDSEGEPVGGPDPGKVAELKVEELSVAIKDLDCRAGYQAVHDQVRIELETEFAAEHAAELEAFRNAVNGG